MTLENLFILTIVGTVCFSNLSSLNNCQAAKIYNKENLMNIAKEYKCIKYFQRKMLDIIIFIFQPSYINCITNSITVVFRILIK